MLIIDDRWPMTGQRWKLLDDILGVLWYMIHERWMIGCVINGVIEKEKGNMNRVKYNLKKRHPNTKLEDIDNQKTKISYLKIKREISSYSKLPFSSLLQKFVWEGREEEQRDFCEITLTNSKKYVLMHPAKIARHIEVTYYETFNR